MNPITLNWQPSDAVIQVLAQNNVPEDFVKSQVLEFAIYWNERGVVQRSWNAKFSKHVMHEWRRHQIIVAQNKETVPMTRTWEPSQDAVNILYKEGVSHTVIVDCLPEFRLFWCDRGDISNTWNNRFVEHVRYKVRTKSLLPNLPSRRIRDIGILEQLGDRGWAKGACK